VGLSNEAILSRRVVANATTINQNWAGNQATSKVSGDNNTTKLNQLATIRARRSDQPD
jgi:minor curlin subunit